MDVLDLIERLRSFDVAPEDGKGPQRLRKAVVRQLEGWEEIDVQGVWVPFITRRLNTKTPLSGFAREPTYAMGWSARSLLEAHGYVDKNGHQRALFIELEPLERTTREIGLVASHGALEIRQRSSKTLIALWSIDALIQRFSKHERFLCLEFGLTKGAHTASLAQISLRERKVAMDSADIVLTWLKEGLVGLELRMYLTEDHPHCAELKQPPGLVRNHGTAWRYSPRALTELYDVTWLG